MKRFVAVSALILSVACGSTSNRDSMMRKDVVETAMDAGMFNTLAKALMAAELVPMLKESGPYTVFAPTDEAFAKLPAGTLEMLMRPENRDKLRSILQYHVVAGNVSAAQVMKMTTANTAGGQPVSIMMMGDQVMIGNGHITKADIRASNGTIHVIDTVLMPPGM
ncbi:MAG TPA: fasciclin domain-containing protein [Thermoanaerobaculia bacterium]|nr:fasciclin domain-containing protein [Thermoanaerobaculia bacterium]